MPAKTASMKRLFCMALAYKKHGASVLKGVENMEQVKKMASEMSEETLVDYCGSPIQK